MADGQRGGSRAMSSSLTALKAAQKSSKGAPLYSVLVNRPLGRLFAALAHRVGLTPNQVTLISAAFTFTGIVALAVLPPTVASGLGISAALVLGYALDAADGQLARLRGGGSLLGEWLDHVIDSCKVATLHLATAVMIFRHYDVAVAWLWLPLGFSAVYVVHFFGMLLTEQLTRVHYAAAGTALPRRGSGPILVSLLKLPTDYGVLCWVFALVAVPPVFLAVYGVLAVSTAGYTVLVLPKWARDLRALDAAR